MKQMQDHDRQWQERIARSLYPAVLLGKDGEILFRNRAAAKLFPRRRSLGTLLGNGGTGPALILHRIQAEPFLVWAGAPEGDLREVRFLSHLPEMESGLFRSLLRTAGRALEAGDDTALGETLRQAGAVQSDSEEEVPDLAPFLQSLIDSFHQVGLELSVSLPGEKQLWIHPLGQDLLPALGQAIRLLCGPVAVTLTAQAERRQVKLELAFPGGRGVTEALEDFFALGEAPDLRCAAGLLPLFSVMRRCERKGFSLRLEEVGEEGRILVTLPASERLPEDILGAGEKRRLWRKKDFV